MALLSSWGQHLRAHRLALKNRFHAFMHFLLHTLDVDIQNEWIFEFEKPPKSVSLLSGARRQRRQPLN